MSWSNVTKPTNTSWTNTNPGGRTQYDQSDITYDSSSMFYDGIDYNAWTDVNKPNASSWTKVSKPT